MNIKHIENSNPPFQGVIFSGLLVIRRPLPVFCDDLLEVIHDRRPEFPILKWKDKIIANFSIITIQVWWVFILSLNKICRVGCSFLNLQRAAGSIWTCHLILPERRRWLHWRPRQWPGEGGICPPATELRARSHPLSGPEMFMSYVLTFDCVWFTITNHRPAVKFEQLHLMLADWDSPCIFRRYWAQSWADGTRAARTQ